MNRAATPRREPKVRPSGSGASAELGSCTARCFTPVDIASLVYFRIAFGVLMTWEVWRYWRGYGVSSVLFQPDFHFKYFGFGWVPAPSIQGMHALFALLLLSAVGIALGLWYRFSAAVFALGFTWWFLIDAAQYLNHFYLICLISFLCIVLPAHRRGSLDSVRRSSWRSDFAPAWTLWLLRFQLAVVYFYGGIAKLNVDWLRGEPVRTWLTGRAQDSGMESMLNSEWIVYTICYGGLLFDLLIVPLLLWPRTRVVAFCLAAIFHLMNHWMFEIGVFPWLALALTALFFPPHWPRRAWHMLQGSRGRQCPSVEPVPVSSLEWLPRHPAWILAFLGVYLSWQLLMPLRHLLYPGPVNWTEEGHRFSWHMKLRSKTGETRFFILDPNTREVWSANPLAYLTPRQKQKMDGHPDMIVQFAQHLAQLMANSGRTNLHVHVVAEAALNGRPRALLIDPDVNLAAVKRRLGPASWILPLENQHPGPRWLRGTEL